MSDDEFGSELQPREPTSEELSAHQRAIFKALSENPMLAEIYISGIIVLLQKENPLRFAHSAHSVRMLLEKLPLYFDLPSPLMRQGLKGQVRNLTIQFDRVKKRSSYFRSGGRDRNVDATLKNGLEKFEKFIFWFNSAYPTWTDNVRALIRRVGKQGDLTEEELIVKVKEFKEIRDFFVSVARESHVINPDEFAAYVFRFEYFIWQILCKPKGLVGDFDEIDLIIMEGERDDNN
jgi:hypothetical protein